MYNDLKTRRKFHLVFILFSFLLILFYIAADTLFFGNQAQKVSLENAINKTKEREQYFNAFLQNSKNQLLAINSSKTFQNYLQNKTLNVDDFFLTISKSDSYIMQIHYLDKNGMEQVRVDKQNQNNQLQDKSQRYYFQEAKTKPLEEVYFSRIDLNIEDKEIEIPHKPTLRAILPINKDGKFGGILIINYFMEDFLNKLFDAPLYDMILLSRNGSILKHFDQKKSWSNTLKNRYTLQSEFPKKAKSILSNTLYKDDQIVSRVLDLPIKNGLILTVQLNKKYQTRTYENQFYKYFINGFIVLLFAIITSIFLSSLMRNLFNKYYKTEELNSNLQNKTDQLEEMQHKLQEINNTLEERVAAETEKSNKHQLLFTQQNKLAQMGEMLSMIAHQWRQPLSAISTAVISIEMNIASNKFDLSSQSGVDDMLALIHKKHNNISEYVKFLSTTIDDFRNFFKTDKEQQTLLISSLINNALHIIQKPLVAKGITILVNYKVDENITVYRNELIQVILNILKNCEDNFQEKNIKEATIQIITTKEENYHCIKIQDNGGGIKEKIIEKIFEPYFSTKLAKNGTGLGLYMSKIMVEEHHKGKLKVYNKNDGVVFEIQLPVSE
jgi:signal transduction histidine kinase